MISGDLIDNVFNSDHLRGQYEKLGFLHAKYNKKVMPGTFAEHHLRARNGTKKSAFWRRSCLLSFCFLFPLLIGNAELGCSLQRRFILLLELSLFVALTVHLCEFCSL